MNIEPQRPGYVVDGVATALSPDLVHVSQSLHRQYDERLGSDRVELELRHTAAEFTHAPVRSFIPLLVRRYTTEALRAECRDRDQSEHRPLDER